VIRLRRNPIGYLGLLSFVGLLGFVTQNYRLFAFFPFGVFFLVRRTGERMGHNLNCDRLWTWVQHEDETFMNRANLFVAAESILFATFAAVFAISHGTVPASFPILLVLVGWIISLGWLYVAAVQYVCILKPLKDALIKADKTFAYIDRLHKSHPTSWVIGIIIPGLFLALWLLLLLNPYVLLSAT